MAEPIIRDVAPLLTVDRPRGAEWIQRFERWIFANGARPTARAVGFVCASLFALGLYADPPPAGLKRLGIPPERHLRELSLTRWSVEDGLPSNTLNNVLQTSDGYLWIASFNGLARFDGHKFDVFDRRSVPVFESSGFHELVEDAAGDLWIGMQSVGARVYRDGEFQRVPWAGEGRFSVRTMTIDDAGEVWIGTIDYGAYRSLNGHWLAVDHPSLTDVAVRDVIQDSQGAMWLATEGKGLVRFSGDAFTTYTTADGLASNAVTALVEGAGGRLWIGTQQGLSLLENGEFRAIDELAGAQIHRLYRDDYGSLWVASEPGLWRRNVRSRASGATAGSGAWERLDDRFGEPLRAISAIAFDREGAVWLACYSSGLIQLKVGKFENYTRARGLRSERANTVYEMSGGAVLIGGDSGIIDVVRDDTVSGFDVGVPIPDVRIRSFLEDSRGRLWVASYAGILSITGRGAEWLNTDNGLPSNQARIVYEDRQGRIWATTRNAGLVQILEDGGVQVVDRTTGLMSNFVHSIDEGPGGELVLGTHDGLNLLHPDGSISSYGLPEGLPGKLVFSAVVDDDGIVWLATNGGLGRFDGERVQAFTIQNGLPAEAIFDVQEDGRGFIWLTSAKGVARISKQQLTSFMSGERQDVEVTVYDDRDGMTARDCTGATKMLKTRDGRLWIPTLKGVAVLDAEDLPTNEVAPPVTISRFTVDETAVDLRRPEAIEIAPGKKRYSFDFAALSLLVPSKVRIKYKLEGFDDDWHEVTAGRSVRYTNLPHGRYALRVIAANNDGVWNEEGATLDFTIQPFFYQTPLFLIVLGLSIPVAARALYRWRIRRVRARNAELEGMLAERHKAEAALRDSESHLQRLVAELGQKNAELERFTYTVSHDLKSPLVTIKGFLGFLEKDATSGDLARLQKDIERIDAAAETMARLLDDLLALSRSGRLINSPEAVPLHDLVLETIQLLSGEISQCGIEIEVDPDMPVVFGDQTRIAEVIQNLLTNAVKFAAEGRSPRIEVGVDPDGACFVRDNGIGIESRYHGKIFELFERLDPATEGTGVGLALAKRIVEVHGGRIWVESEGRGRGSTFYFTLPAAEQ